MTSDMNLRESVPTRGPLSGIRVLDLTHVLNGPFCTMLLGHMGADVIKFEYGKGDPFRFSWMPPDATHESYEFVAVNQNKRFATINFKDRRGVDLFKRMVKGADVVVENFSAGVMERLGLGYEELKSINPKIVYACSRGYGEHGPKAALRANATTIQASTGWTSTAWELSEAPGSRVIGIGDEAAGVSMALGILAALVERQSTGTGRRIDVSMQEAQLGFMVSTFHSYFEREPVGRVPQQCADGYVTFHVHALTDKLWEKFAMCMGHPEAIDDPRFATVEARRTNFEVLEKIILTEWVKEKTRAEMSEIFTETKISAAAIMSFEEMLEDPHLADRNAFLDLERADGTSAKIMRPWIRFDGQQLPVRRVRETKGFDNTEVYRELLGLSDAELERLTSEGVI